MPSEARYQHYVGTNGTNLVQIASLNPQGPNITEPDATNPRTTVRPTYSTDGGLTWKFCTSFESPSRAGGSQAGPVINTSGLGVNNTTGRMVAWVYSDGDGPQDAGPVALPIYSDDGGVTWQAGTYSPLEGVSGAVYGPTTLGLNFCVMQTASNHKTGANERWVAISRTNHFGAAKSSDGINWQSMGEPWYGDLVTFPDTTHPYGDADDVWSVQFMPNVDKWIFAVGGIHQAYNDGDAWPNTPGIWVADEDCTTFTRATESTDTFATAVGATVQQFPHYYITDVRWSNDRMLALVLNYDYDSPYVAIMQSTDGNSWSLRSSNPFKWGAEMDGIAGMIDYTNGGYGQPLRFGFTGDRLYLVGGGPGPRVPYLDQSLHYVYSDDDGLTWSSPVRVKIPFDRYYTPGFVYSMCVSAYNLPAEQQRLVFLDNYGFAPLVTTRHDTATFPQDMERSNTVQKQFVYDTLYFSVPGDSTPVDVTITVSGAGVCARAAFFIEQIYNDTTDNTTASTLRIELLDSPLLGDTTANPAAIVEPGDSYSRYIVLQFDNISGTNYDGDWTLRFINYGGDGLTIGAVKFVTYT